MPSDRHLAAAWEWLSAQMPARQGVAIDANSLATFLERREREAKVEALTAILGHSQSYIKAEIARLKAEGGSDA